MQRHWKSKFKAQIPSSKSSKITSSSSSSSETSSIMVGLRSGCCSGSEFRLRACGVRDLLGTKRNGPAQNGKESWWGGREGRWKWEEVEVVWVMIGAYEIAEALEFHAVSNSILRWFPSGNRETSSSLITERCPVKLRGKRRGFLVFTYQNWTTGAKCPPLANLPKLCRFSPSIPPFSASNKLTINWQISEEWY